MEASLGGGDRGGEAQGGVPERRVRGGRRSCGPPSTGATEGGADRGVALSVGSSGGDAQGVVPARRSLRGGCPGNRPGSAPTERATPRDRSGGVASSLRVARGNVPDPRRLRRETKGAVPEAGGLEGRHSWRPHGPPGRQAATSMETTLIRTDSVGAAHGCVPGSHRRRSRRSAESPVRSLPGERISANGTWRAGAPRLPAGPPRGRRRRRSSPPPAGLRHLTQRMSGQ